MKQIKPMGANSTTQEKIELLYKNCNYIAEKKYDGSRYVAQKDGNGVVALTSRSESVKGGQVDKTGNVPHIIQEVSRLANGTILDGEIDVAGDIRNFKYVQGVMGSLPERALELQKEEKLVYKVFDLIEYEGEDLRNTPLRKRRELLRGVINKLNAKYIHLCEWYEGEEAKRKLFKDEMSIGAEGIILKNLDGIYQEDKKPANTWVKVKHVATYDGIVKGYKFGEQEVIKVEPLICNEVMNTEEMIYVTGWHYVVPKGHYKVGDIYKGGLGTLTTFQYHNGELIEVADVGGIAYAARADYQKRLESGETFIIEFKANELFEDTQRYRHPAHVRERKDKNEKQCIYGKA